MENESDHMEKLSKQRKRRQQANVGKSEQEERALLKKRLRSSLLNPRQKEIRKQTASQSDMFEKNKIRMIPEKEMQRPYIEKLKANAEKNEETKRKAPRNKIGDFTDREKKKVRRIWRESSKRYRERQKYKEKGISLGSQWDGQQILQDTFRDGKNEIRKIPEMEMKKKSRSRQYIEKLKANAEETKGKASRKRIADFTAREKKQVRKIWRESSKRYREKQKYKEKGISLGSQLEDQQILQGTPGTRNECICNLGKSSPEKPDGQETQESGMSGLQKSAVKFTEAMVVKEEPIDIIDANLPSNFPMEDEFILSVSQSRDEFIQARDEEILPGPRIEEKFNETGEVLVVPTIGNTPAIIEVFSLVKTEPDSGYSDERDDSGKDKSYEKDDSGYSVEKDDSGKDKSYGKGDSKRTKDQFDVYGEYVAAFLRKLDSKSCAHVQKAFTDVLLDAKIGIFRSGTILRRQ